MSEDGRPRCATCPHYQSLRTSQGLCRRYPPEWANVGRAESGIWPMVWLSDSCGEHPDFPAYVAGLKTPEVSR